MVWREAHAQVFGETVRRLRREAKLTQEALAHTVGISKNHIQLIEAGRGASRADGPSSNPRMTTVYGLADALNVRPADLLPE
ncbi:helix-turn-helix transcriptional regulator [Microbacterium sp. KSW4-17]|uniref:Helix-turn-helix transcriptional regulator n=1 Tax=Microbacterium galbum TaxID=3075994 RepID=A0ABU3T697_9MICO|nr:helix-turn-helix transcriptional regulator [Microbacterium sp. KSW4-17]MDU0366887.1 helix-turn-helix transcriptional regulator [Microbacterium sp. KSW4-17]